MKKVVQLVWVPLETVAKKQIHSSVEATVVHAVTAHLDSLYPHCRLALHHRILWGVLAPTEQGPRGLRRTMAMFCLDRAILDKRITMMASLRLAAMTW